MKVYKSKIAYGFLLLIFLFVISIIGFEIFYSESIKSILVPSGILLLALFFISHLFFSTKYMIIGDVLKIQSGFIYRKNFDINKITTILKTKTLISSPAASFDRIELKYGKYDSVVISPKEKTAFIEELIKVNPSIENHIKA
jgi:hypothetical protein